MESTRACVCCMPRFCSSWWTSRLSWPLSLSVCAAGARGTELRSEDSVSGERSDVAALCCCHSVLTFICWLPRDNACWQCFFLCPVPSDAFGLSSLCVYGCSVSSPLTHLPIFFGVFPLCLRANPTIHPHPSISPSYAHVVTHVPPFCVSPG